MIKGLSTHLCQVKNMEAAATFYKDTLKLTPSMESPHWTQFNLPGGGSIGLHSPFGSGKLADGSGWLLGVEVEDLLKLRIALELVAHWTGEFHEVPGGVVMDFFDPDGNPIQAIQYGVTLADLG